MSVPRDTFRHYLLVGDHWRAGKAITALRRGQEGYHGPMHAVSRDGAHVAKVEIHPAFLDHLDHGREVEPGTYRRWSATEQAMKAVDDERDEPHEAIAALRYFLTPAYRRPRPAHGEAIRQGCGERTLFDRRDHGVVLVWEEVFLAGRGGLWA